MREKGEVHEADRHTQLSILSILRTQSRAEAVWRRNMRVASYYSNSCSLPPAPSPSYSTSFSLLFTSVLPVTSACDCGAVNFTPPEDWIHSRSPQESLHGEQDDRCSDKVSA